MSTTEPFAGSQLAAALRELNIPDVSAPDLGALPFARGGAGIDYAGIAAAVLAQETRPPVGLPSAPSSFYFLDAPGAPAPAPPTAQGLPTAAEFDAAAAIPAFASGPRGLDPLRVKRDFPILRERVNGRELVWLDNAATTQKPASVIARLRYFYEHENSNVHRGAHELAARATDA